MSKEPIQQGQQTTAAARFALALIAVMRGIAFLRSRGVPETEPVELRCAALAAQIQHEALGKVLLRKGVITTAELAEANAEAAEAEQKRYEQRILDFTGRHRVDLSKEIA